jgi:hypothetical protein
MATLVIDRATLPEPMSSRFTSPRIAMIRQRGGDYLLSPIIDPDEYDIDPDDYPDTTAYLNAIPGCAERLIESLNNPGEHRPLPKDFFDEV